MNIAFTKMEGAGNDFVVIDATSTPLNLEREERSLLADRRRGIGCDQLLIIEKASMAETDFHFRIFNADGGEVEQCGNGVRCVARYIHDHGLAAKSRLRIGSLGGVVEAEILNDGQVRVNMGPPVLEPKWIPFQANTRAVTYALELEGETLEIGAVSMGNPHAILMVRDVATTPVADLGEMLEPHVRFPRKTNVEFMEKVAPDHVKLRVFERGVGETQACGTGACAAVVWGRLADMLDEEVAVDLPGGRLVVSWQGEGEPVFLTGPARTSFEGNIELGD